MFETSRDILNWALAIGFLSALVALTFVFIYSAKILRRVFKLISTVDDAVDAVKKIFQAIGSQISDTGIIGKVVVDTVKLVTDLKGAKKSVKKAVKKSQKKVGKKK